MIALETIENVLVDYDAWKNIKSTVPADLSLAAYLAECKALRDAEKLVEILAIAKDQSLDFEEAIDKIVALLA